jgi:hypothetical protein
MIRVIITGHISEPARTVFSYRIEGSVATRGVPVEGLSHEPLLSACRILKELGEPDDTQVGLVDPERYPRWPDWAMRTSVGYGARVGGPSAAPGDREVDRGEHDPDAVDRQGRDPEIVGVVEREDRQEDPTRDRDQDE